MKEKIINGVGKALKEIGLGIGAFMLMAWLVMHITTEFSKDQKATREHLVEFTSQVRQEHELSERQHEKMIQHQEGMLLQQKEMIVQQRQVTEALGRINGYR